MDVYLWLLLGAAVVGWGAYLVGTSGYSRRDMQRTPLRHHSGEPEI